MLVPVACKSCGRSIGDVAPIYKIVVRNRMLAWAEENNFELTPANMSIFASNMNNMSDILDALCIDKCCRVHVVSHIDFCDHY
jgi:DNA-directed RNA polymerase subunit N (RpoN/RPB10)